MSFLVCALAIALRVAWVLIVPSKPVGDFAMYVESAAHLVAHGELDPEYVYMPGYIFLIAPVQWLGGGWLATKLVGAVLGGLGTGAVIGLGRAFAGGNRRAGWLAGILYACWPAGIAVASVTGTDMPAAVFVGVAAYLLVRYAGERPLLAAIFFGVCTGLGAYIRAIVVPLAALSVLVFWARGHALKKSAAYAALAVVVAFAMLSPWALRNHLRYGETFLTDSHGGLTLLVGANPNTNGCYSRSLNRMFEEVTGYRLLAEPHREADRASLAIAKDWIHFAPTFAAALLVDKAERLLAHERALLYWPLFRQGVLPEPQRSFFARHRSLIENVADGFWLGILGFAILGSVLAWRARNFLALSLLPQSLALAALYTAIFAEPRYRLPITLLCFPLAALAGMEIRHRLSTRSPGYARDLIVGVTVVVAIFAGAPVVAYAARTVRDGHRFAAQVCRMDGKARFCLWRPSFPHRAPDGSPVVKGVWNGVGIQLLPPESGGAIAIESTLPTLVNATTLHVSLDLAPSADPEPRGTVTLFVDGVPLGATTSLADVARATRDGHSFPFTASLPKPPSLLMVSVAVDQPGVPARLWLSDLAVQ